MDVNLLGRVALGFEDFLLVTQFTGSGGQRNDNDVLKGVLKTLQPRHVHFSTITTVTGYAGWPCMHASLHREACELQYKNLR